MERFLPVWFLAYMTLFFAALIVVLILPDYYRLGPWVSLAFVFGLPVLSAIVALISTRRAPKHMRMRPFGPRHAGRLSGMVSKQIINPLARRGPF